MSATKKIARAKKSSKKPDPVSAPRLTLVAAPGGRLHDGVAWNKQHATRLCSFMGAGSPNGMIGSTLRMQSELKAALHILSDLEDSKTHDMIEALLESVVGQLGMMADVIEENDVLERQYEDDRVASGEVRS